MKKGFGADINVSAHRGKFALWTVSVDKSFVRLKELWITYRRAYGLT